MTEMSGNTPQEIDSSSEYRTVQELHFSAIHPGDILQIETTQLGPVAFTVKDVVINGVNTKGKPSLKDGIYVKGQSLKTPFHSSSLGIFYDTLTARITRSGAITEKGTPYYDETKVHLLRTQGQFDLNEPYALNVDDYGKAAPGKRIRMGKSQSGGTITSLKIRQAKPTDSTSSEDPHTP